MSMIVQQDATMYSLLYFCRPLYMFRVVTPSIIRSTYKCNYCRSNCSTTAEGNRDCLTGARCCNYSYMCSWWWVELPPETCRAVYRNIINCIYSHLVGQLLTLTGRRTQTINIFYLRRKIKYGNKGGPSVNPCHISYLYSDCTVLSYYLVSYIRYREIFHWHFLCLLCREQWVGLKRQGRGMEMSLLLAVYK